VVPDGGVIAIANSATLRLLDLGTLVSAAVPIGYLSNPRQPTWAPTGSRLAFVAAAPDGHRWLYAVNTDDEGADPTPLWHSPQPAGPSAAIGPFDPAWSPDGQTVAFIDSTPWTDRPSGEGWDLNITAVAADGSAARRLVDIGSCACFGFSPGLAWSPDGTELAVNALTSQGDCLHIVQADGSGLRFIATHTNAQVGSEGPIAWQPLPPDR
jgi:Tol biopolymer transport system component